MIDAIYHHYNIEAIFFSNRSTTISIIRKHENYYKIKI